MISTDIIQLLSTLTITIAILAGLIMAGNFFRRFLAVRERDKSIEARQQNDPSSDSATVDPGGYIIINLPDAQKSLFMDLLKGFEEYAALKGYRISFSYDGSLPNKVAFRFTILEGGITVSAEKVREDMQEYIRKVQGGANFDDLNIVVPPEKHHMTLMILKNRLSFLQNTFTAQKNALQLYEKLIRTFGPGQFPATGPQFFIQGSGTVSPTNYSAVNSQQIAQGQHIRMIGNTGDYTLNIGNTFNDRKVIADMIDHVGQLLWNEKGETQTKSWEARKYLEKAKDEICDEATPDESRLRRYLNKAREVFSTATFAKEAMDAFRELLEKIGIT